MLIKGLWNCLTWDKRNETVAAVKMLQEVAFKICAIENRKERHKQRLKETDDSTPS